MNQPATMKAALFETRGAPFRLATLPRPQPGLHDVLVRIVASGVNPLDLKIHAGAAGHARQPLPAVLGVEMAGIVEAVGLQVTTFKAGDEVYGLVGGVGGHQGTLAEFIVADADYLAHKPSRLDMRQAAALPLNIITAWEGLIDRARVQPGQNVLIHGGAGGVGQLAVQLARVRGARVFATGSAGRRATIEELGASFIDYNAETVADYVQRHTAGGGFDIVYDTVGGRTLDASFEAVRRFGHVVSALGWGTHALAPLSFRAATYSGVFTLLPLLTGEGGAHHGEILEAASRLADSGHLCPRVDARHFTLANLDEAYRLQRDQANQGKLVIDISASSPATSD
jgi:NADPH:quinone reductase-like Zn-dependent oxidoreductase